MMKVFHRHLLYITVLLKFGHCFFPKYQRKSVVIFRPMTVNMTLLNLKSIGMGGYKRAERLAAWRPQDNVCCATFKKLGIYSANTFIQRCTFCHAENCEQNFLAGFQRRRCIAFLICAQLSVLRNLRLSAQRYSLFRLVLELLLVLFIRLFSSIFTEEDTVYACYLLIDE